MIRNHILLFLAFILTLPGGCSPTKQATVSDAAVSVDDGIYNPYKENVDLLNTIRSTSATKYVKDQSIELHTIPAKNFYIDKNSQKKADLFYC